jgi:pilus assembly protein CpaE
MRVLVVTERGLDTDEVRASLAAPGLEIETSVGIDTSSVGGDHDLLAIACSGYSDELSTLVERSLRHDPGRPVVILSWSSTTGFLRSLLAEGASEILTMPGDAARVPEVFARLVERAKGLTATTPLIAVIGSKGGTGKTLTAANLAVALAQGKEGKRVAVVDADLQFGDIGITLGLAPDRTIYDLVRTGGRVDAEKLKGFMMHHHSGVDALLAPLRPEQANAISAEWMQEVYRLLRQSYDYVVIDTCPGFPPEVITAIDASSHLCVVGEMSASGLKDTRLGLETLEKMGYDKSCIHLILNRVDNSVGLTQEHVAAVLGRQPDLMIPSDKAVTRSSNLGEPIVLQGGLRQPEAARAFQRLAAWFRASRTEAVQKPGLLGRVPTSHPTTSYGKATS